MDKNNPHTKQWLAWLIWLIGALFYFYEFQLQVSPNVMVPELMKTFSVNAAALGTLQATYFLGYASMQIPGGMLLDRFGPRKLLTLATLLCAIGTIIFAESNSITAAEITRFLTGLGSAFALIGALVLSTRWFPSNRFAFLNGLIITIGMLGAVGGEAPLAIMIEKYNWHDAMLILGIIGIGLAVLIYLVVRDHPKNSVPKVAADKPKLAIWQGLKRVLKSRQSWLTATYGGLMYGPTAALGTLWGATFLSQTHGYTRTDAAAMISLLFIGWAAGSPIFGGLSDRLGRRKPPMYIGSVGALIFMLLILYQAHISHIMMSLYIVLFGFFSSGFVIAFSIIRESHPTEYSGTSLGFMNMVNTLGAAAAPPAIGFLLDKFWSGKTLHHVQIYQAADFHKALAVLPIAIFIALMLIPFINETFCRNVNKEYMTKHKDRRENG